MLGLYDLFAINTQTMPEKTALIDYEDTAYTYREISAQVNSLSCALVQHGVGKGSRVGFMLSNRLEFIVCFYATIKLGAIAIPFYSSFNEKEIIESLNKTTCSCFIFEDIFIEQIDKIRLNCKHVRLWVQVDGDEMTDDCQRFNDFIEQGDPQWDHSVKKAPDDDEIILFTSGSTGSPKCVLHSHESSLMFFSLAMMSGSIFAQDDVLLYYAPLFHLAGMSYLMYMISIGGTLILMRKYDADTFLDIVEKRSVTHIFLIPPTIVDRLECANGQQKRVTSSVRWVIMSGGTSGPSYAKKALQLFPRASLCNTYGQTERAANTILYLDREEFATTPQLAASIGKATQFSEIKLIDTQGKESDVGEAYAKNPGMLRGYLNQPSPFVEGWFPTGDILSKDNAGYYWFVDRSKDMIKTGGENVYSLEVEQTILDMEGVCECAVFGLSDPYFGEAVSAAIVLNDQANYTEQDIIRWCKEHMAGFKKPRHVFFVEELPRNSVGKVQKATLREDCLKRM